MFPIAVAFLLSVSAWAPANAAEEALPVMAAELLIVQGDLARLHAADTLPARHRDGLRARISGALGLLPWLLRQAGDAEGAQRLKSRAADDWQTDPEAAAALRQELDALITAHPLNLERFATQRLTATQRREAKAIHETYCAGCHDDAGQDDPETARPARDLFLMPREAPPATFLARLINGVKGDETLLFANPLSVAQISALWAYYTHAKRP